MGWFRDHSANQKINRKISDLEVEVETVKRKVKDLDLEFNTLYDKVRSALGRIAKRARVVESQQEPDEEEEAPLTPSPSDGLTPSQQAWNQRILAARMMRGQ